MDIVYASAVKEFGRLSRRILEADALKMPNAVALDDYGGLSLRHSAKVTAGESRDI